MLESDMQNTSDLILDAAEGRMRAGGYSDVSFRDLAADVSIKSASVHYHFPTKEVLGIALVRRYGERVRADLEANAGPEHSVGVRVTRLVTIFQQAAADKSAMCLCGLLGAESEILPAAVRKEVASFFAWLLDWLTEALGDGDSARTQAVAIVTSLEGALIIAKTTNEMDIFDRACNAVLQDFASDA